MKLTNNLLGFCLVLAVLFAPYRRVAGLLLIALFVALFPANVWAAMRHAPVGGHAWGPIYLLVRAPLQAFFIWWAYRFALRADRLDRNPMVASRARTPGRTGSARR